MAFSLHVFDSVIDDYNFWYCYLINIATCAFCNQHYYSHGYCVPQNRQFMVAYRCIINLQGVAMSSKGQFCYPVNLRDYVVISKRCKWLTVKSDRTQLWLISAVDYMHRRLMGRLLSLRLVSLILSFTPFSCFSWYLRALCHSTVFVQSVIFSPSKWKSCSSLSDRAMFLSISFFVSSWTLARSKALRL